MFCVVPLQLSPYPLMATIIASRSEEDLVGVERSESTSSSSGEESSKPRPKRVLRICATDSPLGPVKEAGQGRGQHAGEEADSGSEDRQSRESSVRNKRETRSVSVVPVPTSVYMSLLLCNSDVHGADTHVQYVEGGWVWD